MLNLYNLPVQGDGKLGSISADGRVAFFQTSTDNFSGVNGHRTWNKPRGVNMAFMVAQAGGGGGGNGFTRTAGSAGGGGGGGASGGYTCLLIPALFLPDVLYVKVGKGSDGGSGSAGERTYVAISPTNVTNDIVCHSGTAGGPGSNGTGSGAASAGTAGSATTIATMQLGGMGISEFRAGLGGTAGGTAAGANGSAFSLPTSAGTVVCGGTGGAGSTSASFAGGAITSVIGSLISDLRPAATGATNEAGSTGRIIKGPFVYGGLGGGSNNSGVGGAGGHGLFGGGGGGGGAGTTGGAGGRGGDGFVIIVCW